METSIDYVYNTTFVLENEMKVTKWLNQAVEKEGFSVGEVVYAFFNDNDLKLLNNKHLNHDYFTDVISFNDSKGNFAKGCKEVNPPTVPTANGTSIQKRKMPLVISQCVKLV